MPKNKIILPTPHAGQVAVMQDARRFNWLSAGRRWRKTTLAMSIGVTEVARSGSRIVWGAPTYNQTRIAWEEVYKAAGDVFNFNVQRMTCTFPATGGQIIFRSLDNPDNARGYTADGVIIDEAGDVKMQAWYEVLRPMLMDTNGWLWAIGTPKGRNWFWREFANASDRSDSMSWQVPTVGCYIEGENLIRSPHPLENPDVPWEEIQHLFNTTPMSSFRQEILAEFLENEGSVFRNITPCINAPIGATPQEHQGHQKVMGVDWGRQNDYTAISVGCKACRQELEMVRFNRIEYIYQREKIKNIAKKWGVTNILAEENSIGLPNLEMLRKDGLPIRGFKTTAQSKPQLIENMVVYFEKELFQFLNKRFATIELEAYEREISSITGASKYNAPDGMNDDTVIARALMLWASRSIPLPELQPTQKSKWLQAAKEYAGSTIGSLSGGGKWNKF